MNDTISPADAMRRQAQDDFLTAMEENNHELMLAISIRQRPDGNWLLSASERALLQDIAKSYRHLAD